MWRCLENTISALVYDLSAEYDRPPVELYPSYNDAVRFVLQQLNAMPRHLALAIQAATLVFGLSRLPWEGSVYHRRAAARRRVQVDAWKRSRLGPCRDLMKLYTSLAVLALYSRPQALYSRPLALYSRPLSGRSREDAP